MGTAGTERARTIEIPWNSTSWSMEGAPDPTGTRETGADSPARRKRGRRKKTCAIIVENRDTGQGNTTPKAQSLHMMNDEAGTEAKKADTSVKTQNIAEDEGRAQGEHNSEAQTVASAPEQSRDNATDEETLKKALLEENKDHEEYLRHTLLSWTACYDDYCQTHRSEKEGRGWFPQRPKKCHNKAKKETKDQICMLSDWEAIPLTGP